MTHVKPTQEELDANAQKALEEAEKLEKPEDKKPEEEKPDEKKAEDNQEQEHEDQEDKKPDEPDYKKKFIESTKEAQILHAKNHKLTEAIDKASEGFEPTEAELLAEYSDWEELTPSQQKIAKSTLITNKRLAALGEVSKEFKDIASWNTKVDTYVDDPKTLVAHPELEGKTEEFKVFATKQSRRGVDFDVLIPAFLYEEGSKKVEHKGKMFETGTGGANDKGKPNTGKISIEQAKSLRETNYNLYKQYLKEGKIESDF